MTQTRPTVAAMQPYLFPYLGYFQLIHHADLFVVADDFPWVDRGWINRNRIVDRGRVETFTVPVSRDRHDDLISRAELTASYPDERRRFLRRLRHAYARAANRDAVDLVEEWMPPAARGTLELAVHALRGVCEYLAIDTPRVMSSERPTTHARGTDRAIALVEAWDGGGFLNPPGGRGLYRRGEFAARGLSLSFLEPELPPYPQPGTSNFIPGLSILDVVLNTGQDEARRLARRGAVVAAAEGER